MNEVKKESTNATQVCESVDVSMVVKLDELGGNKWRKHLGIRY